MAKPFNQIPDYRQKAEKKVEDISLPLKPCLVCEKMTQGYGVFSEGVVCSRKCNTSYESTKKQLIDYVIPKG